MQTLFSLLNEHPTVYVSRDIERALAFASPVSGYHIIANTSPFAKKLAEHRSDITLVEDEKILDTRELLEHPVAKQRIDSLRKNNLINVLVFKQTTRIENICQKNGWNLLNPPATLANTIEEKISQFDWLGDLTSLLPETTIATCGELTWRDKPFILQFNRAHTGEGTLRVSSEEALEALKRNFPKRPVRITPYIEGPSFTVNAVVSKDRIVIGNISYQITGLSPFTDEQFATVGNDWQVTKALLSDVQQAEIAQMAEWIGERMKTDDWKGLFGIDVIKNTKTGKLHLIEINARQPASTTCESTCLRGIRHENEITTFEAHLLALLDERISEDIAQIETGAQIVFRNNDDLASTSPELEEIAECLEQKGFSLIRYNNTRVGSDLLRIRTKDAIMRDHNIFSDVGNKIIDCITNANYTAHN